MAGRFFTKEDPPRLVHKLAASEEINQISCCFAGFQSLSIRQHRRGLGVRLCLAWELQWRAGQSPSFSHENSRSRTWSLNPIYSSTADAARLIHRVQGTNILFEKTIIFIVGLL